MPPRVFAPCAQDKRLSASGTWFAREVRRAHPGPGLWPCTTLAGTPFEPRNFNRRFETRCRLAGVRKITVHATRKTCATLLAALDVHPRVAMRILRHAQIDVTMDVYTEVSDEQTLRALKRLGEQLDS